MLATATITYDLSDYGLADFDSRRTKVWATNNVSGPVVDTEGNLIHLGSANGTVNADGTGSITVPTPGTGSNPASWQTTIHVDYPDRNANRGRGRLSLGPFTITVSGDLADLVDEQAIPPDYAGELVATVEAGATAAAASATSAAASADAAATIVGLTGEDAAVAFLVEDAGSDTSAALSATIATGIEGSDYIPANFARAVSLDPALGDGVTDVTAAVQAAITAAAGGQLVIPAGDYRINVTAVAGSDGSNVGLRMLDAGTSIVMHPGAKLRALASSSERYAVIEIIAADCSVTGGEIVGDIGSHVGTTGEWGHGISIMEAAHRAKVDGVRISKCWGDGICVGDSGTAYTTGARPEGVQINNVVSDDNRRQGISVVSALRLQINGGAFTNTGQTSYTAPGAGIGVEANTGGLQSITDLVVTGAISSRNAGRGLYFNSAANELTATLNGVRSIDNDMDGYGFDYASEVVLNGCHAGENGVTAAAAVDGFYVHSNVTRPVTFNGCTAQGNRRIGFMTTAPDTSFSACQSYENGWAGFATNAARTAMTACRASGNNQVSNFYGQFMLDGGADAHLTGCVSEAGQGATKVGWGYQIAASATGVQIIGCTAKGAFTAGAFTDAATGTIAMPQPGAAKQTGVAVTAAGIHAALVNLGLITA